MMGKLYVTMFCLLTSASALAGTYSCKTYGGGITTPFKTPRGAIYHDVCTSSDRHEQDKSVWRLDNQKLVVGEYPVSYESSNDSDTLIVLQSARNRTGCADQVFLIDLTGERPRVFALGVQYSAPGATYSCAYFHWARWSAKKHSVIALKNNVQFTYSNGRVIPPEDTDTKFGTPYSDASFIVLPPEVEARVQVTAIVRELPLPKN